MPELASSSLGPFYSGYKLQPQMVFIEHLLCGRSQSKLFYIYHIVTDVPTQRMHVRTFSHPTFPGPGLIIGALFPSSGFLVLPVGPDSHTKAPLLWDFHVWPLEIPWKPTWGLCDLQLISAALKSSHKQIRMLATVLLTKAQSDYTWEDGKTVYVVQRAVIWKVTHANIRSGHTKQRHLRVHKQVAAGFFFQRQSARGRIARPCSSFLT